MATAYIAEYQNLGVGGTAQIPPEPCVTTQTVTFSTSTQSAAFSTDTRYIGITADGIFSYTVGSSPTATTSKFRVPAGAILYLGVKPGDKIAFVTNT